jgi:hypothetical protein
VHLVSDTKVVKSKVLPRKVPAVKFSAKEKGKIVIQKEEDYAPTHVHVLQSIGVNLCGIHPADVSSQKLLTMPESNFMKNLKKHLLCLLDYQHQYWKKRCTVRWTKFGDENTKKF